VLEPAGQTAGIDYSYDEAFDAISANSEKDTQVISISATTPSPDTSKTLLDATLTSFDTEVEEIFSNGELQVLDTASIPVRATNVNTLLQTALGAAIGLFASIIALFFVFDYRASRSEQLEAPAAAPETDTDEAEAAETAPLPLDDMPAEQPAEQENSREQQPANDSAFSANSYGTVDAQPTRSPRPHYLQHFMSLITGSGSAAQHQAPHASAKDSADSADQKAKSEDQDEDQTYLDSLMPTTASTPAPDPTPLDFETTQPADLPLPPSEPGHPLPDLPPGLVIPHEPDSAEGQSQSTQSSEKKPE
jgi:hypothetical protein